jgi:hypothetical protein
VYGDWSFTGVPATCTDTSTLTFKFCDRPVKQVTGVAKNGVVMSWDQEDPEEATFRLLLSGGDTYDPDEDIVQVYCLGIVDGEGRLIENPVDALYDMQTELVGITGANIDEASYNALRGDLDGFRCRRWIGEELSSNTLIEELAIECLFDLFVDNDRYKVRSRVPGFAIDTRYGGMEMAEGSLRVEADPETLYCNRVKCEYEYNPALGEHTRLLVEDNAREQTNVRQVIPRNIKFNWLYNHADVAAVAGHFILLYAKEISVISFTAYGPAILTQLADRIGLTFGLYEDRPLVVREISKNFQTMSCTIWGYDEISHMLPGYWTDDDAPDYTDASRELAAKQGFWTDDEGLAQPGNE